MSRIRPKQTLLAALLVALTGCAPYVYQADFSERSDLSQAGDLLGPYTGRVVDNGTGKPLAKVLVYASWEIVRGVGFVVPGGSSVYVTHTDTDGQYTIPKLATVPSGASRAVANFRLVVYRRGYVAYRSDRVYPGDERRFDFVQLDNRIRLERWNPDQSYVDHLRFVGGGGALRKAITWEVQAAVAQIEGRPLDQATAGGTPTSDDNLLDASVLLDEDDIEDVTGYDGGFRIGRLKDIQRTARYDSRHFQAEGKTQRSDAAFRVWRLGAGAAERHYMKLLAAYPKATPRDELGKRSFRSQNKDIHALVWFVKKSGVVVALTCGRALCKTDAMLLKLAKTLHSHLNQLDDDGKTIPGAMPRPVNPFKPVKPQGPVLK